MIYEVYEVPTVDGQGNHGRALAEFRPGDEEGKVRSVWDDTRAPAWEGAFGWSHLLPEEVITITRADLKDAKRREDLSDALGEY